jgi:hypothetical protein
VLQLFSSKKGRSTPVTGLLGTDRNCLQCADTVEKLGGSAIRSRQSRF